jgi:rhodanese-related sulfurtransferase
MSDLDVPLEIGVADLAAWRASGKALQLIDVREKWEHDLVSVAGFTHIPMGQIAERLAEVATDRPVVVMCHHGGRSAQVTRFLRGRGLANATNLAGGIDAWAREIDPALATY